ncbi:MULTISPECIES: hypothetical protein [Paenibacillus]|uniref:hypothetical protein n=2 Tax=Paenibacillus TaxID=44249 RepID=UPI0007BFB2A9|nr:MULTISPECIES: hypothetical protein [Paenibacillus]SOC71708.1 hypothetical protein SAMN05880586_103401 [Paenibacillus sp. RU5M]MCZ1263456.1 hypothetical protein [Paenibacillus tundrae]OAX50551.1 hypothetical protein gpAD87_20340 [Paenibacillus sp. AD87]WDQ34834.1 hypothetical protein PTQ21_11530 [Paenibacillus marchantiae]SDL25076.1 hypothetical protein SAMN05428961_104408 [Paenibacillus sp. OK060]
MNSMIQEWADLKLNVHMYIQEFHGKLVDRKRRPVLLLGMDTRAITFLSDLDLPISPEMLIGLDVEDSHVCVRLHAKLQWKQPFGELTLYHSNLHIQQEQTLYITGQLNTMIREVQFPTVSRFQYEKASEQPNLQETYHYIDFTI